MVFPYGKLSKRSVTAFFVCACIALLLCGCTADREPLSSQNACRPPVDTPSPNDPLAGMVWVPAGKAAMGTKPAYPEERTSRVADVRGFWMSPHEVTVDQFARFVAATGYVTLAEREIDPTAHPGIDPELLVPGGGVFAPFSGTDAARENGWSFVPGAHWRQPLGPDQPALDNGHYPVTQVSVADARAYAEWLGHRLPNEDEWEYAAKGGALATRYPWGDLPTVDGRYQANTWQGFFPLKNTAADGFVGVAPVGCFAPNGFGLYDMVGNVWELVDTEYSQVRDREPTTGLATIKGGSFLCAENFCGRFRPSARQPQERDMNTNHVGFRTIVRGDAPR